MQLEQQKIQIQMAEQQRKAQKDQADFALEQEKLELERQKLSQQFEADGFKTMTKLQHEKEKLASQNEQAGFKTAIDALKGGAK